MSHKRVCAWLPVEYDWENTIKAIGTAGQQSESHPAEWLAARDAIIDLLDEASCGSPPGVLVLSTLSHAQSVAATLGVDLSEQTGRARIAVELLGNPVSRVLGIKLGGWPGSRDVMRVGWALLERPAEKLTIKGKRVIIMEVSEQKHDR